MGNNIDLVNAFDLGDIDINSISVPKANGAKKVAVLLLTLGTDISSEIIKKLPDRQIQRIGIEIANLHTISTSERKLILEEFVSLYKKQDYLIEGGLDFTKNLLYEALGNQKGEKILEEIRYDTYNKAFTSARNASVAQLMNCIKEESPQTIAIILSHIQSDKAGQILSQLPAQTRLEVALKIGTISSISPAVIKAVDLALESKLSSIAKMDLSNVSGLESLIEILNNVDRTTEKDILGFIEERNTLLSEQIKANMFVFEDLVKIDSTGIQRLLKEINVKDIACALKNASAEIQEVIFSNQSKRASDALKEEIEMLGSVKNSKVEDAQQKIVAIVRRLENEGVIEISKGTDDGIN